MRYIARALALCFVLATLTVGIASAHGDQQVGPYSVVFGWRNEPAYAGQFNGPEVLLGLHDDHDAPFPADVPVELKAEVTFGPATTTVFLEPARGETGHYIANLIPTLPGDYRFHLTGTIGEEPVDLTFDSADGEFSSVNPAEDILFPAPDLDAAAKIADLEARLAALEARLAALEE